MPIELTAEIDETGFEGNYWVLTTVTITRGKTPTNDVLAGTFRLFKSQTDYAAKRATNMSASVRIVGDITGSTTAAQMITALETEIIKPGEALDGGTIV